MTVEGEIKQFVIRQGADLVGIASVADINKYAPPGHRPDDILTDAKSVITFAGRPTLQSSWHSSNYQTLHANLDFPRIRSGIANAVSKLIQSRYGYYALAGFPADIGSNPNLSLKLCAELAGLGTRSMAAAILLNRKVGMINISICITTMPLVANTPIKEPICPHPSCVKLWEREKTTPCLATCPMCLSGELENGQIKWMKYDRRICFTRAQAESENAFIQTLLEGVDQPNPESRRSILLGSFSRRLNEALAYGATFGQCSECLRHCPICIQARTLKVKKLNTNAARGNISQ